MGAPEPSRLGTLRRVVIADAGPLIGLARIGCLDLLRALFGGVTLTAVVAVEIGIDPRPGASAIAEALAAAGALDPWHRCRYGLGEGAAADSRLRAAAGGSA